MKICFVALHAYPIFINNSSESIGGAEIQQVLIARELIKKSYQVSFVVGDFGQPEREYINGIELLRSYKLFNNQSMLRHPMNMLLLMKDMEKADADVYLQRAGMFYTGQVALFCKVKRKRFIYSAGHDRNCNPEFQTEMNRLIRILYRYGLKKADVVVAQSEYQSALFKRYYGVDSVVIKSGYLIPPLSFGEKTDKGVLWVGKALDWKRPELFLELARRLRDISFEMVCAPAQQHNYYEKLRNEAEKIPNLRFHGFIPINRIDSFFEKASVFVNTSSVEGFPNTFLQAWSRYVPTITLDVDPDECICRNGIGIHSKSFERMVEDVRTLIQDGILRDKMGLAGRAYVEREHDIKKVAAKYSEILETF